MLEKKLNRILTYCVAAALIISSCLLAVPVNAAGASSEFDFSAIDSIDKYDEYRQEEFITASGEKTTRVCAGAENRIPMDIDKEYNPDIYRYGAYLRYSGEVQRYYFLNLDFSRTDSTVWNNTLTIYADPGVKFAVTDMSGELIVNTSGVNKNEFVKYYKKSVDNGHTVYYIELNPMAKGKAECMITFSTESEDTQPHYSFWFGSPLVRKASAALGTFTLSVTSPYTVSASYPLRLLSTIPERAWVNTVTINKLSSSGDSYVSSVNLNVTLPNSKYSMVAHTVNSNPMVFHASPNLVITSDARGTYNVNISRVSWHGVASSRTYQCRGQASVEYLYAFGA